MPYTSEKQHRAMRAAAAGKSTLGIPQSVGREYVKAGPSKELEKQRALAKALRGGKR